MPVNRARTPSEARPARMGPLARLPVFLALDGKRAVLAGGSPAAAWKAELLSAAGAHVDVYAEDICPMRWRSSPAIRRAARSPCTARAGRRKISRRRDRGRRLRRRRRRGRICGRRARRRRSGQCHRQAGVLRFRLRRDRQSLAAGDRNFHRWRCAGLCAGDPRQARGAAAQGICRLGRRRRALAQCGEGVRAVIFRRGASSGSCSPRTRSPIPNHEPTADRFRPLHRRGERAWDSGRKRLGDTWSAPGPGDPELLTLRAVRALQSADVILFDDLVSREVLDFARREARKMLVGKTGFGPSCKQEDINALMVSLARQGKRVVRLKGGDPLIFGRAAEEIAACRGGEHRGRRGARHHRGARRCGQAWTSAHRPQTRAPAAICHRPRQRWRAAERSRLAKPCRSGDHDSDLHADAYACSAG